MSLTTLERARAVERPNRDAMLQRTPSVQQFWEQNRELFQDAWKEWEAGAGHQGLMLSGCAELPDVLSRPDGRLYAPCLAPAVSGRHGV